MPCVMCVTEGYGGGQRGIEGDRGVWTGTEWDRMVLDFAKYRRRNVELIVGS